MSSAIAYTEVDLPAPSPNPDPSTSSVTYSYGTAQIDCPDGSEVIGWSSRVPIALGQGCTSTVLTSNTVTYQVSRHNLGGVLGFNGQTIGRVGIAKLPDGSTVVAWAEWTNNQTLMFAIADRNMNWFGPFASSESSLFGIDIAPLGTDGTIQITWTGMDPSQTVNYATAMVLGIPFGGTQEFELSKQMLSGQTSLAACGIAARTSPEPAQGMIAWTGTDANHSLNLMGPLAQGSSPAQSILWNDNSGDGPRLCYMDAAARSSPVFAQFPTDHAYLTWVGTDLHQSLNILDVNLGDMTGTKFVMATPSQCAPSLISIGPAGQNQWFMAWIDMVTSQVALAFCPNGPNTYLNNWQMLTLFGGQARASAGVTLCFDPVGQQILVGYADMALNLIVGAVSLDPTQW